MDNKTFGIKISTFGMLLLISVQLLAQTDYFPNPAAAPLRYSQDFSATDLLILYHDFYKKKNIQEIKVYSTNSPKHQLHYKATYDWTENKMHLTECDTTYFEQEIHTAITKTEIHFLSKKKYQKSSQKIIKIDGKTTSNSSSTISEHQLEFPLENYQPADSSSFSSSGLLLSEIQPQPGWGNKIGTSNDFLYYTNHSLKQITTNTCMTSMLGHRGDFMEDRNHIVYSYNKNNCLSKVSYASFTVKSFAKKNDRRNLSSVEISYDELFPIKVSYLGTHNNEIWHIDY